MGQRRHGHAQLAGQLAQVKHLRAPLGNGPRTILHPCKRQQLIGQVGQAISALGGRLQGVTPDLRLAGA
ncbi:hypothetical protein D9M71_633730 [compost metagenome]